MWHIHALTQSAPKNRRQQLEKVNGKEPHVYFAQRE